MQVAMLQVTFLVAEQLVVVCEVVRILCCICDFVFVMPSNDFLRLAAQFKF